MYSQMSFHMRYYCPRVSNFAAKLLPTSDPTVSSVQVKENRIGPYVLYRLYRL